VPLKVLLGHNTYQWPGGEDVAVDLDERLLTSRGHEVVRYVRDNDEIASYGPGERMRFAVDTVWSRRSRRDVAALLAVEKPDIAHFHNSFPLISPSAFAACRDAGVPVVLTVQNYRVACANAFLFRDGGVCEDCLHRTIKWPAVVHACYHESRPQSAVVAGMLAFHKVLKLWPRLVDAFIVVSGFGRDKLVEAGLPAKKVLVRANFSDRDPGDRPPGRDDGYALFVGRLSPEKGLATLLDAAELVPDVPFRVAGDGPLRAFVEAGAARCPNIELLGHRDRAGVFELMRGARVLVFPSLWYEHYPYVLLEAFASGLPVVSSALGAMNEIVGERGLGLTFPAGDAGQLADRLRWAWDHADDISIMGRAARASFEECNTAGPAYQRLMEIYDFATTSARSRN
jgi:glycosyltransferase involved in cell wall biosynthesis